MSDFYSAKRGSAWNYGGKSWKLSRSKIELFMGCPRCFYIDNKLGTKRPPGPPFSINSAVDHLLKQEFDTHRAKGEQHPLQKAYGIDAIPASHEELNVWRENFKGICFEDPKTGMTISGAIDDLWINGEGEYIVVDYKATAKDEAVTELNQEWQDGYKRQMEIYQWLLRQLGYKVSNTGYFVYCTGRLDRDAFDGRIDFDINLIEYVGNDSWVRSVIDDIEICLESDSMPAPAKECDFCAYSKARQEVEIQ